MTLSVVIPAQAGIPCAGALITAASGAALDPDDPLPM
jgi:hypothetical protein